MLLILPRTLNSLQFHNDDKQHYATTTMLHWMNTFTLTLYWIQKSCWCSYLCIFPNAPGYTIPFEYEGNDLMMLSAVTQVRVDSLPVWFFSRFLILIISVSFSLPLLSLTCPLGIILNLNFILNFNISIKLLWDISVVKSAIQIQ